MEKLTDPNNLFWIFIVVVAVFLVIREFWCWYFKSNNVLDRIKVIDIRLDTLTIQLQSLELQLRRIEDTMNGLNNTTKNR